MSHQLRSQFQPGMPDLQTTGLSQSLIMQNSKFPTVHSPVHLLLNRNQLSDFSRPGPPVCAVEGAAFLHSPEMRLYCELCSRGSLPCLHHAPGRTLTLPISSQLYSTQHCKFSLQFIILTWVLSFWVDNSMQHNGGLFKTNPFHSKSFQVRSKSWKI